MFPPVQLVRDTFHLARGGERVPTGLHCGRRAGNPSILLLNSPRAARSWMCEPARRANSRGRPATQSELKADRCGLRAKRAEARSAKEGVRRRRRALLAEVPSCYGGSARRRAVRSAQRERGRPPSQKGPPGGSPFLLWRIRAKAGKARRSAQRERGRRRTARKRAKAGKARRSAQREGGQREGGRPPSQKGPPGGSPFLLWRIRAKAGKAKAGKARRSAQREGGQSAPKRTARRRAAARAMHPPVRRCPAGAAMSSASIFFWPGASCSGPPG